MKATNSIVQRPTQKVTFSSAVTSRSMQELIHKSVSSPERAAALVSTLISSVSKSPQLAECKPETIVAAGLQGEAMGLSITLGQFGIIPYGDKANFQLQYKGLAQLAMRTGEYEDFDVFDVRAGEYAGRDPKTRSPILRWIEDEDAREQAPIIGYYAFYRLKNGFTKSIYWSRQKVLKHADRYSRAFSLKKYEDLLNGKLGDDEVKRLRSGTPWYDEPGSEAHSKMCKKTMLIQLLGDGKAPLAIDRTLDLTPEGFNRDDAKDAPFGVVVSTQDATDAAQMPAGDTIIQADEPVPEETKRAAKRKEKAAEDAEAVQSFFEGGA